MVVRRTCLRKSSNATELCLFGSILKCNSFNANRVLVCFVQTNQNTVHDKYSRKSFHGMITTENNHHHRLSFAQCEHVLCATEFANKCAPQRMPARQPERQSPTSPSARKCGQLAVLRDQRSPSIRWPFAGGSFQWWGSSCCWLSMDWLKNNTKIYYTRLFTICILWIPPFPSDSANREQWFASRFDRSTPSVAIHVRRSHSCSHSTHLHATSECNW